jgi:MFS family permease
VAAASLGNVALLFASLFIYGAGFSTNLQARYAGADLAAPSRRGRAVSIVLVATAVGAIIGPNLVRVTGTRATRFGIPALVGPFMLAGAAYAAAGIVLWLLLRPDPLLLARRLAAAAGSSGADKPTVPSTSTAASESRRGWSWAVAGGAGIMILTQLIMVAIMTITPIHIEHHGHGIGITGVVIAAHVAGMFLPSPFSGWLVDRFGCLLIAAAAGSSCCLRACSPRGRLSIRWEHSYWRLCCSDSAGTWGLSAARPWLPMLCRWLRAHAPKVLSISASHLRALVAG